MTTAHAQTQLPASVKATKKRRTDAYVARLTISIPLDMANADSLAAAIKSVAAIEATLPAGSAVQLSGSLSKI